jgi:hypothetical protein
MPRPYSCGVSYPWPGFRLLPGNRLMGILRNSRKIILPYPPLFSASSIDGAGIFCYCVFTKLRKT